MRRAKRPKTRSLWQRAIQASGANLYERLEWVRQYHDDWSGKGELGVDCGVKFLSLVVHSAPLHGLNRKYLLNSRVGEPGLEISTTYARQHRYVGDSQWLCEAAKDPSKLLLYKDATYFGGLTPAEWREPGGEMQVDTATLQTLEERALSQLLGEVGSATSHPADLCELVVQYMGPVRVPYRTRWAQRLAVMFER